MLQILYIAPSAWSGSNGIFAKRLENIDITLLSEWEAFISSHVNLVQHEHDMLFLLFFCTAWTRA